jgi:hypothetical protein
MRLIAITLTLLVASTYCRAAKADDTAKRSPEMQVLARFVGTWDVKFTSKAAEGEKVAFDLVSTRAWSLGGRFIRFEDANNLRIPEMPEFQMLLTYDPDSNNYPGVTMDGPSRGQLTGTWDEKSQTMAFSATFPDGNKFASTHRFIGKSRAEAAGTITSPDGKIVVEMSWNQTRRNRTSTTTKSATKSEKTKPKERFDHEVREYLFAGFGGDKEALQRGLKTCEETLEKNPKHAEALVWRGAVRMFQSGQAFNKGDFAEGMKNWKSGLKDMDDAIELEPDNIGVLIPRAAAMLPAGRSAPPAMGKPLLIKVRADFERTYKRQKNYLDQLGEHPLGELRMGLADVYRLLGQLDRSKEQLSAIQKELPDTKYALRATDWLAAPPNKKLAHNCIGCHVK